MILCPLASHSKVKLWMYDPVFLRGKALVGVRILWRCQVPRRFEFCGVNTSNWHVDPQNGHPPAAAAAAGASWSGRAWRSPGSAQDGPKVQSEGRALGETPALSAAHQADYDQCALPHTCALSVWHRYITACYCIACTVTGSAVSSRYMAKVRCIPQAYVHRSVILPSTACRIARFAHLSLNFL